jgi:hypothetical protein
MRASYFGDYERYAIDSLGNRVDMEEKTIWYRNALVCNNWCAIGKDFISSDYGFTPVVKIDFPAGSHKVSLLMHHVFTEFEEYTNFFIHENSEILLSGKVHAGEIHQYEITLCREENFSLCFSVTNSNITYAVLRFMLEDEPFESDSFLTVKKKVSRWKRIEMANEIQHKKTRKWKE